MTTRAIVDRLLDDGIGRAVDWCVGALVGVLVLLVLSGILARYIFNHSLAWSDELAGLLFVWLTMTGSVAAMRRKSHMAMGVVIKMLAPARQRIAGLCVTGLVVAFLVIMLREGIGLAHLTMGDVSPVLDLPVSLYYLSVPFAGALMLPFALRQLADIWYAQAGWRATDEEIEED